jgi:hypothetical protein
MSDVNSTAPTRPSKPYAGYPLFPHANGSWAKKVKGKLVYFGPWSDPQGALERYRAYTHGTTPATPDTPTIPKPPKPYPDYPLFPHGNGSWAKKIRGHLHYFGPWSDPDGALK